MEYEPRDIMTERVLEIYQEVMSKRDLSAKATELANTAEALHARMGLLRENIVSSVVVLVRCTSTLICDTVKECANQRLDAIEESLAVHSRGESETTRFEVY